MTDKIEKLLKLYHADEVCILTKQVNFVKDYSFFIDGGVQVRYDSSRYTAIKNEISLHKKLLLVAQADQMIYSNRLLWECDNVCAELIIDTDTPWQPEQKISKKNTMIWDMQAKGSKNLDPAELSGWMDSYEGKPFSESELWEYVNNTLFKTKDMICDKNVLEIGIGGGQIALELSKYCNKYDGCDISTVVLEKLSNIIENKKIQNIRLIHCGADHIDEIGEKYDVVIFNSVIQYFSGYNYFSIVLEKCFQVLKENGAICFFVVYDLDLKDEYSSSIRNYERMHEGSKCKKNFEHELFYPRAFWNKVEDEYPVVEHIRISKKLGKIENELIKYRYDVILKLHDNDGSIRKKESGFKRVYGINDRLNYTCEQNDLPTNYRYC